MSWGWGRREGRRCTLGRVGPEWNARHAVVRRVLCDCDGDVRGYCISRGGSFIFQSIVRQRCVQLIFCNRRMSWRISQVSPTAVSDEGCSALLAFTVVIVVQLLEVQEMEVPIEEVVHLGVVPLANTLQVGELWTQRARLFVLCLQLSQDVSECGAT